MGLSHSVGISQEKVSVPPVVSLPSSVVVVMAVPVAEVGVSVVSLSELATEEAADVPPLTTCGQSKLNVQSILRDVWRCVVLCEPSDGLRKGNGTIPLSQLHSRQLIVTSRRQGDRQWVYCAQPPEAFKCRMLLSNPSLRRLLPPLELHPSRVRLADARNSSCHGSGPAWGTPCSGRGSSLFL